MKDELLIKSVDDEEYVDAYETYGVTIGEGVLSSLLAPAPMKSYIENTSRLEAGTHLSGTARVDSREVTLTFIIKGQDSVDFRNKRANFVSLLQSGGIRIRIPSVISKFFTLYYSKSSSYAENIKHTACKMAVKFIEPRPYV